VDSWASYKCSEVTKRSDLFSATAVLDIKAVWFVTAMAFTYVRDVYGRNPRELVAESSMDWRSKQRVSEACYAS
jgi:hypothetical protein